MPVLSKHTKHLSLADTLAVGVDSMQRNFAPVGNRSRLVLGYRLRRQRAKGRLKPT